LLRWTETAEVIAGKQVMPLLDGTPAVGQAA
jgi:hypothetical protein